MTQYYLVLHVYCIQEEVEHIMHGISDIISHKMWAVVSLAQWLLYTFLSLYLHELLSLKLLNVCIKTRPAESLEILTHRHVY
jgi:hypothetical protein